MLTIVTLVFRAFSPHQQVHTLLAQDYALLNMHPSFERHLKVAPNMLHYERSWGWWDRSFQSMTLYPC